MSEAYLLIKALLHKPFTPSPPILLRKNKNTKAQLWLWLWYLTSLSTIFQLYCGGRRGPEYLAKTTATSHRQTENPNARYCYRFIYNYV